MRRRRVSNEERSLWESVARKVERLEERRLEEPVEDSPSRAPRETPLVAPDVEPFRPAPFVIGSHTMTSRRETASPAQAPLQMDKKLHGKLKRGRVAPEARIDLHGMTLHEAHRELDSFIALSHQRGLRLVLVITGKGRARDDQGPIPSARGLIRIQAPIWLKQPHLAMRILEVVPAAQKHGGGGALYVYLKR